MENEEKHKPLETKRIISGGQTGADRAAFDFALENGFEMGGFVPRGRRAEDGEISGKYPNLVETSEKNYAVRTELNIINSDAVIIFSHGKLKGGSRLTRRFAKKYNKPFMHIDFLESDEDSLKLVAEFLETNNCKILNIAGSRASTDSLVYQKTKDFLTNLFV